MLPQTHARTAGMHAKLHVIKLSRPPKQCGRMQVKMSVNAGMAKLVNLGKGIDLVRGERCEGVKKEGRIKKQNTRLYF